MLAALILTREPGSCVAGAHKRSCGQAEGSRRKGMSTMGVETKNGSSVPTPAGSGWPEERLRMQGEEDWSFASLKRSETLWGPHGYHRYPAKFIPQLVRRLIETYSVPGDRIGDPFLGSATTGVEALRAGRFFWGSDINPVALLISRAKCTPLPPEILEKTWKQLEGSLRRVPRLGRRGLTEEEKRVICSIRLVGATAEERLTYWFPQEYQHMLATVFSRIEGIENQALQVFFLCAFSNILRNCSIWLSGSTKPQKDLQKRLADPVEEFCKQVHSMIKRNALYWHDLQASLLDPETIAQRCHIDFDDVRTLSLADQSLDLLVTSPPYATCYEYSEMHQLSQLWFERSGIVGSLAAHYKYIGTSRYRVSRDQELGSTGSPSADQALSQLLELATGALAPAIRQEVHTLSYYFHDMKQAFSQFARVVVKGKRLVLIIGDSYRRGITIPTTAALSEMAIHCGFVLEQRIVRRVAGRVLVSTRDKATGRFSSTERSDTQVYPEESILVFQRLS